MIKLLILIIVLVIGLVYFDVIDLDISNDTVKEKVDESVNKASDDMKEKLEDIKN